MSGVDVRHGYAQLGWHSSRAPGVKLTGFRTDERTRRSYAKSGLQKKKKKRKGNKEHGTGSTQNMLLGKCAARERFLKDVLGFE